jgi:hypothetical protein
MSRYAYGQICTGETLRDWPILGVPKELAGAMSLRRCFTVMSRMERTRRSASARSAQSEKDSSGMQMSLWPDEWHRRQTCVRALGHHEAVIMFLDLVLSKTHVTAGLFLYADLAPQGAPLGDRLTGGSRVNASAFMSSHRWAAGRVISDVGAGISSRLLKNDF